MSPRSLLLLTPLVISLASCVNTPTTGSTAPSPEPALGACGDRFGASPFHRKEATHLLVADLLPSPRKDLTSAPLSDDVVALLDRELKRFQEAALQDPHASGGVPTDAPEVGRLRCSLDSHEQARNAAKALGADIVIWGRARCEGAGSEPSAVCPNATLSVEDRASLLSEEHAFRLHGASELELPTLTAARPLPLVHFALGMHFYERDNLPVAARFLQRASAEVAPTERNAETLELLAGWAYLDMPDNDAALLHSRRGLERVKGSGTRMEALLLSAIGRALDHKGDEDGALSHYRRALAIEEKASGKDDPNVAIVEADIGGALEDKGDYDSALSHYRRALAIDEKASGRDHTNVATDLNNVGRMLANNGDLDEALSHFRRALAIDEKVFGKEHRRLAAYMNNIGSVLQDKGDLDEALSHYRRALAIDEKAFGKDHPEVATALNSIGSALQAKGDLDEALSHYRRALAIDEKAFGMEDPHVAIRASNIGFALKAKGDYDGALSQYRRALAIFEKQLGPDHPNTLVVSDNIAFALGARNGFFAGDKGHPRSAGVLVLRCLPGCQGFAAGDWVTTYDGHAVTDLPHLDALAKGTPVESAISILVVRDKKKVTLSARGGPLGIVGY